jgi:hypothetical protein
MGRYKRTEGNASYYSSFIRRAARLMPDEDTLKYLAKTFSTPIETVKADIARRKKDRIPDEALSKSRYQRLKERGNGE